MHKKLIFIPFLFILLAIIYVAATTLLAEETRLPNDYEVGYQALAADLKSAIPCNKISPKAQINLFFNPDGSRISNARSSCFYDVAMITGDKSYCKEVKTIQGFFYSNTNRGNSACYKNHGYDNSMGVVPFNVLAALKMDSDAITNDMKQSRNCVEIRDLSNLYQCYREYKSDFLLEAIKHLPDFIQEYPVTPQDTINIALLEAIRAAEYDNAKSLLEQGANINFVKPYAWISATPLLAAIGTNTSGSTDFEHYLIEHGADINLADSAGVTPLSIAYEYNRINVLKLLLEKGVSFDNANKAFGMPTKEQVDHLIKAGKKPNTY